MVLLTTKSGYMRVVLAALAGLHLLPTSLAAKGDTGCRREVCVSASVEGDVVNYEVTGMIQPVGWLAIGFGTRMPNTHSVIMWKNDDGSTTLSQRYTSGYTMPHPESNPPRIATLVEPKALTRPAHSTTFAFQVPANRSLLASADPKEAMIFAYSPTKPDKAPDSTLTPHQYVGYLSLDFSKDFAGPTFGQQIDTAKPPAGIPITQGTGTAYKRVEKLMILHGFLVSFGFLVLLPAGSLIARWGRSFTPRWFKLHRLSNMYIALPVITLGVLLGPAIVYSKESFRIHFANGHEIYGGLLLLVYYTQVFLGRYIHNRRNELAKLGPITQPHPPLNIFHIVLGIIRSGMQWWETLTGRGPITNWALPLWKAWIVILPLAYFGGYALLPRQFRLEKESAYAPLPVAATEDRAQSTRLLGEDEEERGQ
ncbi:Cytochrome b561 and DOMON domain-containing protein [Psilocybe cubensis]|uniref:DOMON domain-containing protein n=2 Tax=Psilocybe cubensis TaxID=181762 RepID=A0A8H7Y544_PSICU|nr:Cytochrome b561 and DOMON domain-containing protein [Psilocybe cubensis]KAH9483737.1 Cytochrome b561 and DOMON domain-containing protein [Psilocybe cubensis]